MVFSFQARKEWVHLKGNQKCFLSDFFPFCKVSMATCVYPSLYVNWTVRNGVLPHTNKKLCNYQRKRLRRVCFLLCIFCTCFLNGNGRPPYYGISILLNIDDNGGKSSSDDDSGEVDDGDRIVGHSTCHQKNWIWHQHKKDEEEKNTNSDRHVGRLSSSCVL